MGHNATGVDKGLDGLKAVETSNYDLAFVDIKMPGIDGIDFLRRLKKITGPNPIPVFIMTGHGADDARDEAMTAGASGFLCKPFGYDEIQRITDEIIESMEKDK